MLLKRRGWARFENDMPFAVKVNDHPNQRKKKFLIYRVIPRHEAQKI